MVLYFRRRSLKKLWETALKSDLGSTRGLKLLYSYMEDIDNPPLAMILQASVSDTKGTLPTGIGGTIFTIIQSKPILAYKQYNLQFMASESTLAKVDCPCFLL